MSSKKTAKQLLATLRQPLGLALLAGVGLLVIGLGAELRYYRATHHKTKLPDPVKVVVSATNQPDETKPDAKSSTAYTVPDEQPRSITINSVAISGLIQKVGIASDNSMAVPSNINFAGWYVNSALPGQLGLSIIDGHVSGKYTDAIFKRLGMVKINDVIEVEFGDRSVKKFTVLETKKLPVAEAGDLLYEKRPDITAQLNLITCGGTYIAQQQTFTDRIIVVAKLE